MAHLIAATRGELEAAAVRFTGFGPRALPFFKALAFHQTKEWFEANRQLYETEVRIPLGDLVEALADAFAAASIPLKGSRKSSVFRINRDVRFSKNKDPYKTSAGALLSRNGTKNDTGIFYFHLAADGCFTAAGFYLPEPPILARLRRAIVGDPGGFTSVVAGLAATGLALSDADKLARSPRDFEHVDDPLVADALKLKSLICSRPLADARLADPHLVEDLVGFAQAALPLLQWGWSAVADAR